MCDKHLHYVVAVLCVIGGIAGPRLVYASDHRASHQAEDIQEVMGRLLNDELKAGKLSSEDRLFRAYLLYLGKRYAESMRLFEEMLQEDPKDRRARIMRNLCKSGMRNFGGALDDFEEMKKEDPDDPEVWFHIGVMYQMLKSSTYAREIFEEILLRWQPDHEEAIIRLAGMAIEDRDFKSARKWLLRYMDKCLPQQLDQLSSSERAVRLLSKTLSGLKKKEEEAMLKAKEAAENPVENKGKE